MLLLINWGFHGSSAFAQQIIEDPKLQTLFDAKEISGTFAIKKIGDNDIFVANLERAQKQFIPASTFKIPNSLIALETKVIIKNVDEVIPYGGKPQPFKAWERDMSMREAIRVSNLPIYQELAKRIGLGRYEEWLGKLEYGNQAIDTAPETFWLQGPLVISAVEQIEFIGKLTQKSLPLSEATQSSVIKILNLESKGGKSLYGKTGWTRTPNPDLGWFVGWVDDGKSQYVFALNMDIENRSDARKRISVSKQILGELGIY